ncbi:MAG: DNA recombination protein RmuC [Pseudolabrys sp.]|jgi:DNA recombination protein RmuC|nr:DNA recombination protein RmuC [Pseudolabrys sp.]
MAPLSLTDLIVSNLPVAVGLFVVAGVLIGALIAWLMRPKPQEPDRSAEQGLAQIHGRIDAMGSWLQNAHGQLQQSVNQRLDAVTARLGDTLQSSTKNTTEHLQQLHARLAVIDSAQKNITELATQVNTLQGILTNKQARGAFGQGQLEAIVADVLPKGAYEFQFTLKNRSRPDCAIFMPDAGPLIIDAKFPLEAMNAWRNAATEDERRAAVQRVRQDIGKHISDIAEKYLVPGETQDIALMFIPSESIYADLHERFDDVVQRAQRARVMIVSPTLCVMAIQIIKQVRKDAEMREAADQIRTEVGHMMKDVTLLGERVNKLKTHFGQANKDIDDILTSAGRIGKRASNIEALDFGDGEHGADILPGPVPRLETGK